MRFRFHNIGLNWPLYGLDLPIWFRFLRLLRHRLPLQPNRSLPRRVLFVAHNQLMLRYLLYIYSLIKDDDRIACWCTSVSTRQINAVATFASNRNLNFISPGAAVSKRWDMVMVSDHIPHNAFHPSILVVMAYHAIDSTKVLLNTNRPELYRYAHDKIIRSDGTPFYACMFESSQKRKDEMVAAIPVLDPVISVTGDLQTDEMLAMNQRRRQIREELACHENQTVVLLGSTHGTESMMEMMGREIIATAKKLQHKYRFIVSTHPHHWDPHGEKNLTEWLLDLEKQKFIVHRQPEPLARYLVACDVAVTDFGSMAVSLALLSKPMIIIDFPRVIISEQSTVAKLAAISPRLADPSLLDNALEEAIENYPVDRLQQLTSAVLSCPGEAKKRIINIIRQILELKI